MISLHTIGQVIRAVFNRHLDADMSDCAYWQYQRNGGPRATCTGGCYEGPACITNEPINGWPSTRGLIGRIRWALGGE